MLVQYVIEWGEEIGGTLRFFIWVWLMKEGRSPDMIRQMRTTYKICKMIMQISVILFTQKKSWYNI